MAYARRQEVINYHGIYIPVIAIIDDSEDVIALVPEMYEDKVWEMFFHKMKKKENVVGKRNG